MTFDRDTAPLKTYQVWSSNLTEQIDAPSSFIARQTFAKTHGLDVTEVKARVSASSRQHLKEFNR